MGRAGQPSREHTGRWTAVYAYFKSLGPGLVTGASDDDPTNISTFSQTGVLFGYTQLWTVLYTIPMMIVVQDMCARIAIRTGSGLTTVMREHYAKPFLYTCIALLCLANVANIGADLGAMADTARLFIALPAVLWIVLITLFILLLQVFLPYARYANYLRWLTLALLAYVVTAFLLPQHWGPLLRWTIVPTLYFTRSYWLNLAAILGTSISPYLFFWQASQGGGRIPAALHCPPDCPGAHSLSRLLAPAGCGDGDDFLQRRLLVHDRHRRVGLQSRARTAGHRAAGRPGTASAGRASGHP